MAPEASNQADEISQALTHSDPPASEPRSRLPDWPRGLSDQFAAAYVGLGVITFREAMAQAGVNPVWLTKGRRVWLREDLDRWLDGLAGRQALGAQRDQEWRKDL